MHNLKDNKHKILFNSLAAVLAGAYVDSVSSARTLFIKTDGLQIPFNTGATIEKSCADPGNSKMTLLELTGFCPCDDCDHEYGVTIRSRAKTPGVFNDKEHIQQRSYNGSLERVECTGGLLNDDLLLSMEDDIIMQINADINRTGWRGSDAKAFRVYRVTLVNDTAEVINITINGTTTSINLTGAVMNDATGTGNTNLINANATVNPYVRAIGISATEMLIVGQANGEEMYIDDGGGTAIIITNRYMGFMSNDKMVQVDVEYDSGWANVVNGWIFTHAAPTAITLNAISISENGGAFALVAESTVNVIHLTNIDAPLTYAEANYNDTADVFYIAGIGDLGVTSLQVNFTTLATSVYVTSATPFGKWPMLTNDEVFRVFNNMQHMGDLSTEMRMNQPTAGVDYCKYTIKAPLTHLPAQHGPSRYNEGEILVDIYVPKALVWDSHWTAGSWNLDTEAGANRGFQQLLEYWLGSTLPY